LDASAAFSEVEVQPLLGGGAPPIPAPAIPAITSTLHEPRSEGAEPRALPPQPNQTPSQTPAPNKALTAVRRAAVAKRPLAADPLQTSAQVDSSAPHAPGNAADGVGNETPALETPASPDSGSSDETPGQQTQDRSPELTAGNTEAPGASVDLGSSDLSGSLQAPFPPEAPSRSSAGDTSGTQLLPDPLDPAPTDPADPSGDEPIDPSASTGPLTSTDPLVPPDERAADDPNCPALKPDPARFLTPPGPAGSIALVPPARGRSDYWTSGTAETGWGAEPEAVDGTAIRPSRYG